jgi:hypothetical protein
MIIGLTLGMIPGEQDRFLYLGRHQMGNFTPSPPIRMAGKTGQQWPQQTEAVQAASMCFARMRIAG